ncbi:16S rRNA (cytosine(1402)-N(4))-methyltransferase [hydrothermal vent metagenome]|uniref:16S rRNA (Cytosine(1402)-N(4))-methyltransferase n=1 Tax=hydrothermal vent metagenome TaxID=652676 RepID=A0A3B0RUH7_9ZZZZ
MSHQPVMLDEVVDAMGLASGKRIVDCTFGAGGYSRAFLQVPGVEVLALDRDPSVLPLAAELTSASQGRFSFHHTAFSGLEAALVAKGWSQVDGIVLDIGVSSMQIDQSARGFSFMQDGPLDMRMSMRGVSAADVVNQMGMADLIRIFRIYGEEKRAKRAAEAIVLIRAQAPIKTTGQLAGLIETALGGRRGRIHPATKVFQALRIFVNDELGELARLLLAAERVLAPAGRLVVVTFHSLEDRLVKTFFRRRAEAPSQGSRFAPAGELAEFLPSFELIQRKVMAASDAEITANRRARSAKLRGAIRTSAPAFDLLPQLAQMPDLALLEASA